MRTDKTAVYRLFDAADRLLYVGVGEDYGARWDNHRTKKTWWDDVDHAIVKWYATRTEALAEEIRAIRSERPLHNIAGTGRWCRKLGPEFAEGLTIAGAGELAIRFNISRQRVQQLVSEDDFPAPCQTLAAGRIWRVTDIEQWIRDSLRIEGERERMVTGESAE